MWMRRVLVIGSGGSGKSTLARRLGELLNVEVIHLDWHFWRPGWVETPKPEWRETVVGLLGRDAWVMDGNFSGTLDLRLEACDTVIFIDLPRALCLWRVIKRLALYRRRGRPDMAEGCGEKLDFKFMRWVWDYPERTRPDVLEKLEKHSRDKRVIHLRSRAEVESFLAGLNREA